MIHSFNLETIEIITYLWIVTAILIFVTLFFVTAAFGRHSSEKWGWMINNKFGWFIMELPSLLIMVYFLFWGSYSFTSNAWILFVLWIIHYLNRTLVYPLRIKTTPKKMPLLIALSAIVFNIFNAGLNGYYLAELAPADSYDSDWLMSTHFLIGIVLFVTGMGINWKSDSMLIHLRKANDTAYHIPRGFLFEYVSTPNLFGEIIEWMGFALMAWNLPALSFFIWTLANLIPRARMHHKWYKKTFAQYPENRKIVFPFLY